MFRLIVITCVLIALASGAAVWSSRSEGPAADFVFCNRADNKTLDLGVMSWMQDMRDAYALWEGLYTSDPLTLKPVPGSALPAEVNADQTVYTFHVRPEARWSNGDPLTAGDFVFAWRRLLEQPGEYTYLVEYIKGAGDYKTAYADWKTAVSAGKDVPPPSFASVGIEQPERLTLRVTLAHPVPFFYSLCAFPTFFPQHEPSMRPFAKWDPTGKFIASYDQAFTRPPHLVTNGPYKLTQWSFKRRLRMEANEFFWNKSAVKPHIIDQINVDDAMAAVRMFKEKSLDWMSEVDDDLAADMMGKNDPDLKSFASFGTYFYDFNCQPKLKNGRPNPFADRRVRRALVMAIDKRPIVQNITRAGELVATTVVPLKSFPTYPSPPGIPFDIARAQALLAEAGYPNGQGFPPLHLMFNNDLSEHVQIAQVLRRQWQQNLNITLDLEGVEVKVFAERLHQHDFNLARASWYGDYYDPSTFTDVFRSTSDNNDADWRVPAYDAILNQAESELDPKKRFALIASAENMLLEDAPIMPIYQYVGHYLFRGTPEAAGIPLDSRQMIMLSAVVPPRRH